MFSESNYGETRQQIKIFEKKQKVFPKLLLTLWQSMSYSGFGLQLCWPAVTYSSRVLHGRSESLQQTCSRFNADASLTVTNDDCIFSNTLSCTEWERDIQSEWGRGREEGREGDRDLLQTWQHVLRLSSLIKAADLLCLPHTIKGPRHLR